ncbi:MAG: hypothetical protein IKW99_00415 [Bacteroidales bacterium]|nr:hypothetical protein [Bacteroidales bacterium]
MRKWEDIVREELEEYESALPEGSLDAWRSLRDNPAPAAVKRFPFGWAVAATVAAGIAAVLFLHDPIVSEEGLRTIDQPTPPIVNVVDTAYSTVAPEETGLAGTTKSTSVRKLITQNDTETEELPAAEPAENSPSEQDRESSAPAPEEDVADKSLAPVSSPYLPKNPGTKSVSVKVGLASGAVAGGGLLVAMLSSFLKDGMGFPAMRSELDVSPNLETMAEATPLEKPDPKDELTGARYYYFPVKAGLSVGIPVAGRLRITSGLQYSRYTSSFIFSLSGERTQYAHYLGVPVRLDWLLASGRWLDLYVGGGVEGDLCVGATFDGRNIRKDGFGLSLLGAGGVQFNPVRRVGLYVEPGCSWTIPSEKHVLNTYRSENPFMFSVSAGVRLNLGK